jgi:hypothetical protein
MLPSRLHLQEILTEIPEIPDLNRKGGSLPGILGRLPMMSASRAVGYHPKKEIAAPSTAARLEGKPSVAR